MLNGMMDTLKHEATMIDDQKIISEQKNTELEPLLEVRNITKQFPGVLALNDVSLKFMPGEVHAVVGENGAGKSTLMKIMAGAYVPDSGDLLLQGERVSFKHPQEAQLRGVSIIYQEFNLLPDRTVAQNIFLGREPGKFGALNVAELNQNAVAVLKDVEADQLISPVRMCNSLSVAEQQIVEVAKAISFDSRVLIMDEPTASLSSVEVKILTDLIAKLKARGMAIIFISHRLIEVFDIADKITVLKDGELVGTVMTKETTPEKVIHMMVGRELDHYFPPLGNREDFGEVVLRIKDGGNDFLKDINLELRKGEVLGISGLQGSGRTELAQALFGVVPFKTGSLEVTGKIRKIKSPPDAIRLEMGFVTEDRKAEGLLPKQSIRDNILLAVRSLQPIFGNIFRDGIRGSRTLVPTLARQVDLRTDSFDRESQFLSGGNQQKVVLSKWLSSKSNIFIFDEPTRGIDVEAKAGIHDMIRGLTKQGIAVLMISSELPEILGMSDRIIVMRDGRIAGELPARSTEAEVMLVATGHARRADSSQNSAAGEEA
jgi:ribose transport system ATP-binding protein